MLGLIGFGAVHVFGIALDYIVAGLLVAGGLYVFAYFRWLGLPLIVAGAIVGATAYGRTLEAANCIAASRLAEAETKLNAANRDLEGWIKTADLRSEQLRELQKHRGEADARLAEWQTKVSTLEDGARRCRAATRDDDRRLCALVKNRAPGCDAYR